MHKYYESFLPGTAPIVPAHTDFLFANDLQNSQIGVNTIYCMNKNVDIGMVKSQKTSEHCSYFKLQLRARGSALVFSLALVDSGNSISWDGCLKQSLADRLQCTVIRRPISIGLASSSQRMQAIGYTTIQIRLSMQNDSHKIFNITVLVINNLQDNCTALAQQMRFWQGVFYNPCPLSLSLLCSPLLSLSPVSSLFLLPL